MWTLSVHVARVDSECTIRIGCKLLEKIPELVDLSRYSSIAVVSDNGARSWAERVAAVTEVPSERIMLLEGGERSKSVQGLESVWKFLSDQRLDRRSLVLSVGGGAVSDLVGFAASTYMRGIAFVHVPTTLLAQVDASVGGKSGINFGGVKNLVGSINQPIAVVVDVDTLSTLPAREFHSGFAEIVKHGLIADAAYFERVTSKECSSWDADEVASIIHRSCEIKRDVVQADETETGLRKTLNFGHTIGHAIEAHALTCGVSMTHGEAVSIGMVGEAYLSMREGRITKSVYENIVDGISRAGLPTRLPVPFPASTLRATLARDKKNVGGAVKWTLLDRIGNAVWDIQVSEELIIDALSEIQPIG